jgi:hypothetical protein
MQDNPIVEAAAWLGRQQAFAVIASKCTAAQAQCLRQIKESRAHDQLGLTWEEFCTQHAGISRVYADTLIRRLDEFGDSYFKLSQLARVSPETYRQISEQIHDNVIELDGECLVLEPANAHRIRTGIQRLQNRLREKRARRPRNTADLQARLDTLLADVELHKTRRLAIDELTTMRCLCGYAINKWRVLARHFDAAKPV